MKRFLTLFIILIMLGSLFLSGCAGDEDGAEQPPAEGDKVTIALQFGLGYAPVQIMKEKGLMEKYLPGVDVEWKQLGTGPVIRDAMVTGQVDIGFMGISPFLIGWDKGADWKIATASGSQPLGLVTYKDNIQNISDFSDTDKIATPAVASIQHILLSMAAEDRLGDARAFDNIMVSLTHPDAAASLLSKKDVTAHFASPPYLFNELDDKDIHQVLSGEEAFGGEFTFIFGVATEKFHAANPPAYAAFIAAFNEAITFINNNPREAAKILAPQYTLSEDETYRFLTWEGTNYSSTPYGIMAFADFMHQSGYIDKMPENITAVAFENIEAAIGKRYGEPSTVEKLQWRNSEKGAE